ncbi:MAG: Ig-like domain-containing protein, partial [Clostridiales Family XIII bacterium]|nr:Ig-like domain-containing protein [Clostridiales Family XIII bacterium]
KATLPVVAYDKGGAADALLAWESSKPAVATVDAQTGKVTAKKAGTAKITATALNGKKLAVTVKVVKKAKAIGKISLVKPPKTMQKGKAIQLRLKVSPAGAAYGAVVFRSSKPTVVGVDKAGTLTAKKAGKATITVKIGNRTVKHSITVK